MGGSYPHSILLFSALFPPSIVPSVLGAQTLSGSAFPKKPGEEQDEGEELSSENRLGASTLLSVYPSSLSSEAWAQEVFLPLTGVLCRWPLAFTFFKFIFYCFGN